MTAGRSRGDGKEKGNRAGIGRKCSWEPELSRGNNDFHNSQYEIEEHDLKFGKKYEKLRAAVLTVLNYV
jgi:hypothetical protein